MLAILVCMCTMLAMAVLPNAIFDVYTANFGFDALRYVRPDTIFYHCAQQYHGVGEYCATADLDAPWPAPPPPPLP